MRQEAIFYFLKNVIIKLMRQGRPFSKLTPKDLIKIKELFLLQGWSKSAIARKYKVHRATIIYHLKKVKEQLTIIPVSQEKSEVNKNLFQIRQNIKEINYPTCPDFLKGIRSKALRIFRENYGGYPKNSQEWNMFMKNYKICFPHWS